jgi:arylformamidase
MAPHAKGPPVFLDYDQEELDAAYDQAPWAPNRAEIGKRTEQKNAAARARLGTPRRLAYGPSEIEKLDLYAAHAANAPLHIFIHGGAWRVGSAASYAYQAEMLVAAGAHFIALDFNNVLETAGDLMTLAEQVRRAVAWVYRNAASFGGDPERLYVSGHSSGGHLAAVVLTTDWQHDYRLPMTMIKGGLCASGIYDLYPVSLSARSRYVRFTPEVIEALSPMRHLDKVAAPMIVGYGTAETPEFQRQSREFAAALEGAAKPVTLIVAAGYNHFEIVEDLGNPYGVLGRAVLEQMKLGV